MGDMEPPEWMVRVKEDTFKAGASFLKSPELPELLDDMDANGVARAIEPDRDLQGEAADHRARPQADRRREVGLTMAVDGERAIRRRAGRGLTDGGDVVVVRTAEGAVPARREDLGDDTGVIYVVGEVGLSTPVKIGLARPARHAHKRMLTFATGNFRPLERLAEIPFEHARWIEYRLHCVLTPWWVKNKNSREWFDVRHLVTDGWEEFVARALPGNIPNAGALPEIPNGPVHHLDHVHGRPRHLRAVCSCRWVSEEGSVYAARDRFRMHAVA